MKHQREYWLALSTIEGLGSIRISKLLQYFGDALSIWKASEKELFQAIGIRSLVRKIVKHREKIDVSELLDRMEKHKINYMTLIDTGYPEILKNIYDPPPVLFYKGEISFKEPAIAIVGSRRSTGYGRKTAEKLAYELVQRGITVISGLARGIDTHGHIGALKAKGRTIAVLGSGLDIIYPPDNKELFIEIIKKGLVISEYPPGVEPYPGNFPQRNRIISALSMGIVVIEAAQRSGSLITADLALEQGKEVFAVPGNIDRPGSRGTNNLIKNGAKLVTGVDDILEELFLFKKAQINNSENGSAAIYPELKDEEKKVLKVIQEDTEVHINDIIQRTGWDVSRVNTILLKLELKGLVSKEPGKKYCFLGLQNLLKPL